MADRTLHLLFLDQYGQIGGGQRILLDLVSAVHARGWMVDVLCPSGPLADAAHAAGAKVHALHVPPMRSGPKSPWALMRAAYASHKIAQEHSALAERCDLVVVNGPRTLAIARPWVRKLGKPALLYLHGVYGRLENMIIRSFLALPNTAAVAPSAWVAAPFSGLSNVHRISNWVSREFLEAPEDTAHVRQVLGITDVHPIVLVPGRFSPNKGQRLVLEASHLLSDVPCHFVFAGAPLFEMQGREVAAELVTASKSLPDRIHVTHWKEAMPSLYDGSDLVVVPSVWEEPFGLTVLEAMARARPLIVTDRGALPGLADSGRVAQVVGADASAIAAALREFFGHRGAWGERAREARKHVETQYHPDRLQQEVLALCSSLLSS
ncbi:MAG: glycosyltransferase family 4 protein [Candidatus Peribacteraceae bacterium]|nr:glycosyltransferase family 4 protein [Candidatus Peribacteraceae bacterium]MDD5742848.1 glycosyltransferase family 4 protein [Candidatus Peribacteraceae bacterium]